MGRGESKPSCSCIDRRKTRALQVFIARDGNATDRATIPHRMLPRLPWTIWAYILWDLCRLIVLTAGVLVTVIAFSAAVKPLADGKLGPAETLKFMLLAMPPMLQYALPFAACFGATLAYHRLSADNEITACHAAGISHRTLIFPAFATGIVLALVLLVLSNRIIPSFLRQMGELVSQDISKFIVHQIKSGEAVKMDSKYLFADDVVEQGPDASAGAFQKLWLPGLLLIKLDKQGNVEEQASAREATVWLRRVDGGSDDAGGGGGKGAMTEVVIRPRDAVFQRKDKRGEIGQTIQPFLIPNSFTEDPKYLTDSELRDLHDRPERIQDVDRRRRSLALTLAQLEAVETIREALRGPGHRVELFDGGGQKVVLKAADIRARRLTRGSGGKNVARDPNRLQVFPERRGQPIIVERTLSDGTVQSQKATSAEIRLPKAASVSASAPVLAIGGTAANTAPNKGAARVAMTLQMLEVSAQDLDENGELIAPVTGEDGAEVRAAPGVISEWALTDLTLANDPAKELLADDTNAVMARADARMRDKAVDREAIRAIRDDLENQVNDLMREVLSKRQERLAMAAACLVMVLTGTIMAMRLRDSLPLTIYLWAFFPALAAVISISAGQRMTHGSGLAGLPLLWAGVVVMGIYAVWEFVRLIRH